MADAFELTRGQIAKIAGDDHQAIRLLEKVVEIASTQGVDGTFTSADGKTITVTRGLITDIT